MATESDLPATRFFSHWIRASALGWLLGIAVTFLLGILWDTVGITVQFIVGIGLGLGVGFMQERVLRAWIDPSRPWLWASLAGMGLPFVLADVDTLLGLGIPFSLPLCILIGALLAGILQGRLLNKQFENGLIWIVASLVGWGVPLGLLALEESGHLPETSGLLAAMVVGGVLLGVITGPVLQRILNRPRTAATE